MKELKEPPSPFNSQDSRSHGNDRWQAFKNLSVFSFFLLLTLPLLSADPPLRLTNNGIGPITQETPFDKDRIQNMFPGYYVEKSQGAEGGAGFPILRVIDKTGVLFIITPQFNNDKIWSLQVESDRIKTPFGLGIGDRFQEKHFGGKLYKKMCEANEEEYLGAVLCIEPQADKIRYVFEGIWDGPDGVLPPIKELSEWKITQIIWKAFK